MIIPIEWLKDYLKTDKNKKQLGDDFTSIGLMVDKPTNEHILDLEHRMDRSDWLSIIGCARDVAAFNNIPLNKPKMYSNQIPDVPEKDKINITVEATDKVNRFKTVIIKNIEVKESPEYIKTRLENYGIPSINNIVDITNYVMVELGQPMHAQDINKLEKNEIILRDAKENEELVTLLGEKVKLVKENFVLSSNDKPLVIGGIVGGKNTGVTKYTTDIILDAGNYNQDLIRKASRKLKIQNETVLRYDKFLSPLNIDLAINRAIYLILELAGGEVYFNDDYKKQETKIETITLNINRIKQISGLDYDIEIIKNTLNNLEYKIISSDNDKLVLEIPFFRTDIQVEDDIVSDILRINDYQNIPAKHIDLVPPKEITSEIYNFEEKLKDICVNLQLHEHITDPLIDKNNISEDKVETAVLLENPLTSEKSALRQSIKETLFSVYENYLKNKYTKVGLFEVGKVYTKNNTEYNERRVLQIIYVNNNVSLKESANEFKAILSRLLSELQINWSDVSKYWQIDAISMSIETEKLLELSNKSNRVESEILNLSSLDFSITTNIDYKFIELYTDIMSIDTKINSIDVLEEIAASDNQKNILFRVTYIDLDSTQLHKQITNIIRDKKDISIRQ